MPFNYKTAILTLASHNFERLVGFYIQLLDQEPATVISAVYAEFHLSGLKLGIFRPKKPLEAENREQKAAGRGDINSHPLAGMSLCLEVEDLEAAIDHLTQLGYPPSGNILTASHGREIYACDPDGNWLILHQALLIPPPDK